MQARHLQLIHETLQQATRILVLSPGNVDGDCMGANVVLHRFLKEQGKTVEHVCFRTIPEKYAFYPDADQVKSAPTFRPDLVVVTDTAERHLLGLPEAYAYLGSGEIPLLNIDHHISNANYGTVNVVEPVCSASFMIWEYVKWAGIPMTQEFATSLLAGIYFDTGGLMHSNTTAEVFQAASELFTYKPDITAITDAFFRKTSVSKLKLWGRVFEKAQLNAEGVLMSAIVPDDFAGCEAHKDDLDGAVEYLNYVPEKKFSLLVYDTGEGKVKGSFRTQDKNVDVNRVAKEFGGGGHTMAAGFMVPGRLEEEVRWRITQ